MGLPASTWILVADSSKARLFGFDQDKKAGALQELRTYSHPESRARNQELVTDRPGRVQQSGGGDPSGPGHGSRSGMEPDQSAKDIEHEHFARELGAELTRGLNERAYGRLVLVANPEFLGTLRRIAEPQVLKRVALSVDKDYTALAPRELQRQLAPLLAAA